jgi:hypothetical protein
MNPFLGLAQIGVQSEYNQRTMQYHFSVDAERYTRQQASALAQSLASGQMGDALAANLYGMRALMMNTHPSPPRSLKDRREERWRQKLFHMKDKAIERRIARVAKAAWVVGWMWGSLMIFVLTSYLVKWAMRLVLG